MAEYIITYCVRDNNSKIRSEQIGTITRTINPDNPQLATDEAEKAYKEEVTFLKRFGRSVVWRESQII